MKDGVVIVNTARGGMIDSEAILEGLDSGKISAIGLDVCNEEYESAQLPKDPLVERSFGDNRVVITPHAGGSTYDAHGKVFGKVAELIENYLAGQEI
jgi:phosphoglycerate dehydrogenase-like enzyme